jgi:hypothetical protein
MTKTSALTLLGDAFVDEDRLSGNSISIIRGGNAIILSTEDENGYDTDIVIHSAHQAQAIVSAIRGIAVSQGWEVV